MAMRKSILPASLMLLLFLVLASDVSKGVEARTCDSQSHKFKGTCLHDSNCALVCRNEGFPSGKCVGLRRRCFCEKPC